MNKLQINSIYKSHIDELCKLILGKSVKDVQEIILEKFNGNTRLNRQSRSFSDPWSEKTSEAGDDLICVYYHQYKTDFSIPGSLALRGTIFKIENDIVTELVCLPFFKFFNKNENKILQETFNDIKIHSINEKLDGSLIKVFCVNNEWKVATNKTAGMSEHFFNLFNLAKPKNFFENLNKDYFYCFELTSDIHNLIKVRHGHETPRLTLLLVRDKETFDEILNVEIEGIYKPEIFENFDENEHKPNFEGYVLLYENTFRLKVKTKWYNEVSSMPNQMRFNAILDGNRQSRFFSDHGSEKASKAGYETKINKYLFMSVINGIDDDIFCNEPDLQERIKNIIIPAINSFENDINKVKENLKIKIPCDTEHKCKIFKEKLLDNQSKLIENYIKKEITNKVNNINEYFIKQDEMVNIFLDMYIKIYSND